MSTTFYQCGKYIEVHSNRISSQSKKHLVVPSTLTSNRIPSDILVSQSYHRAKNNVKRLLLCNLSGKKNTDIFFTFTYSENMTSYEQSQKDFDKFRKRCRKAGFDYPYIVISERQKRGAIHHHGVFFGAGKINIDKMRRLWRHGFIYLQYCQYNKPITALANYLTKYITKDAKRAKNAKFYRSSWSLTRPKILQIKNLYVPRYTLPDKFSVEFKNEYKPKYSLEPTEYTLLKIVAGASHQDILDFLHRAKRQSHRGATS
jgi:hypothetical protein